MAEFTAYDHQVGGKTTDAVCEKKAPGEYMIDGQPINLPVMVRKAKNAFATFIVDAKAAQDWIADTELQIVEIWPGKAIMQIIGVDYIDNDLGNYKEAGISFYVRSKGGKQGLPIITALRDIIKGNAASYIHYLPVDQDFTKHAGRYIWGYPKWNTDVRVTETDGVLETKVFDAGEHIFTFSAPVDGKGVMKPTQQPSLAMRQGNIYKTVGVAQGTGMKFKLGGDMPQLGTHPIARRLRSLGLPKKPLMSGSVADLNMEFGAPIVVKIGDQLP